MDETQLEAARRVAFRFIAYAPRSSVEIERRLETAGFDPDVTAAIVEELAQKGLVDDTSFASDWIEDRADRKRYGKVRLMLELRRRGISAEAAREALGAISEQDEVRRALEAAEKRQPINRTVAETDAARIERSLYQFLLRRGFGGETIKQVLVLREENRRELS